MKTTALILNWNTWKECRAQLESLRALKAKGIEFIVIDNDSALPGGDELRHDFPEIGLIQTGENLGFTGAFNLGIRQALKENAECVVLLNPDLVFPEDPFPAIHTVLREYPEIGVIAPAIYNDLACKDLYCLGWNVESLSNPYRILTGLDKDIIYPTSVLGCFMAIRREVFEKGVWFDEAFYNYYEESDFCLRARGAGFEIAALPKVKVCHTKYAATGAYSPLKSYYLARNLVLFSRKHADVGLVHYHILRGFFGHWAQAGKAPKKNTRKQIRKALWEGLWDGLCGRFGRARRYLKEREKDPSIKGLEE